MASIDVRLPDGRLIRVNGAESDDQARQAVNNMLAEERRTRPIDSFFESGVAGARGTAGAGVGALEAGAAAVGAEGVRDYIGGWRETISGDDANPQTRPPELRDLISRNAPSALAAYAGQGFGSLAGIGVGTLAGAAAGAMGGGPGGAGAGAVTGTLAAARAAGVGELYRGLVDEGVDPQTAGMIAIPVGYLIGRIETRYLDDFLQRQLAGRVDPGIISRVSQRLVGGRAGGVRATAAAGAISEGGGEALRQATIGTVTGDPNLAERAERVAEEALVGTFPGAALGAASRIRGRADEPPQQAAAAAPQQTTEQPAPTAQPESVLPPEPEPFTTAEEARQFLAQTPEAAPRINLNDEQLIQQANQARQRIWQQTVETLRAREIDDYTGINRSRILEDGRRDFSGVADTMLPRIYDEAVAGNISLVDGFSVEDLTNAAMRRLQVEPANADYARMRTAVEGLVADNYLNKNVRRLENGRRETTYQIALRNFEPARQMAFERAQRQAEQTTEGPTPTVMTRPSDWQAEQATTPTPQVRIDPNAPTTQAPATSLTPDMLARRQQAEQAFLESDPTATLAAIAADANFARQFLDKVITSHTTSPYLTYPRLRDAFRREGLLISDEQAASLMKRGKEVGVLTPLNNYIPAEQRAQLPENGATALAAQNAAAVTQAENTLANVAATGNLPPPTLAEQDIAAGIVGRGPTLSVPKQPPIGGPTQKRGWQAGAQVSPTNLQPTQPRSQIEGAPEAETFEGEAAFQEPDPNNEAQQQEPQFAAPRQQPSATPQSRTKEEREAARREFDRVVGNRGRLTFEQTLFLDDLGAEVRQAAINAGIDRPIAGYALGDMAVLSLADSSMPLNQVAIHEGWHVAENIGLIKADDIALLNASRDTILSRIRNDLNFVADPDSLPNNEVRAYGLNARASRGTDFGPLVNRIFDRFVNMVQRLGNFVRGRGFRTWRDVYDDFLSGRTATSNLPGESTFGTEPQQAVNFAAPYAISTPAQGRRATQQYFENQIAGPFKWAGSLRLTIAKERPALRPAADNMQTLRHSNNEAIADLENYVEPLARLKSPESRAKVGRIWQEASMTGKAPNLSTLNAEERAALQEAMAGVQRGFDWLIDSLVMRYYTPNAKMSAAERTRLENFWAKHEGKHLWEIPQSELRAASTKGFAEFQRLNKMRNPYKMPAIADGSHFIAVYKRNAKGEREGPPLRMIAYTPRNRRQRFFGRPDPEKMAIAELQRQYPDAKKFYVMQNGREFTMDAAAQSIRGDSDAVAQFLTQVSNLPAVKGSTEARNMLNTLIDQMDKAKIERVFKPSNNILQAVNDYNQEYYLNDSLPRYFMGIASIQARWRTQEDWAESIKNLTPADQKWLNDLRNYSTTPTEAFGGLRTFTFFYLLGFAPDTALINALQVPQVTMPMMIRDGGVSSLKHFARAYREVIRGSDLAFRDIRKGNFQGQSAVNYILQGLADPGEKAAYTKAMKVGTLSPLFTNESRGQVSVEGMRRMGFKNPSGAADNLNKLARLGGSLQQYAEQVNRAATFLAAYRAAVADPTIIANKNRADNQQLKTPYDYATAIVDDTHYITSKEDRALLQRFTPLAEPATQFMSFVLKTMEIYARHALMTFRGIKQGDAFMAKAGAIGFLAMTAPLMALGGLWALPGAEFLKEALERIILTVWGTQENFDADMKEAVGGGYWGEVFTRGLPAANNMVSLGRRIGLDPLPFNDLMNANIWSLFGPSTAVGENFVQAIQYANRGDLMNAAAAIAPRALGNVIKGADMAFGSGEIRSQRGNVLLSPEQVAEIDAAGRLTPIALKQAIGMPAPEIASLREAFTRREEMARQNRVATQRLNDELAGYLTAAMRAEQRGNSDEASRNFRRFDERIQKQMEENDRYFATNRPDRAINFNMNSVQQRAYEDLVGRTSLLTQPRGIPRNIRPVLEDEMALYDWRRLERERQRQ